MPNTADLRRVPRTGGSAADFESLLLLAVALAALLIGASCSKRPPTAPANGPPLPTESTAPAVLFSLINTSTSSHEVVPTALEETAALSASLPREAWVSIFKFDRTVEEVRSDIRPASGEGLLEEILPAFARASDRDLTYTDRAMRAVTKRILACQGRSVLLVYTDAYSEGVTPEGHREIQQCAAALAKCDRLCAVFVVGVEPEQAAEVRADLAPLAAKLRLVGPGRLDRRLVRDLLAAAGGN